MKNKMCFIVICVDLMATVSCSGSFYLLFSGRRCLVPEALPRQIESSS